MATNIAQREAFQTVGDGSLTNVALFFLFGNGELAAAIVSVNRSGNEFMISPLFISVTPLAQTMERSALG